MATGLGTLTRWARILDSLWMLDDPDEVLMKAGKNRQELRKVAADEEVATALDTRSAALLATPWRLEGPKGPALDFCTEQLQRHATQIMEAAWEALPYGYSVAERIYVRDGGRVVVDTIESLPFEWFTPKAGGPLVMHVSGSWVGEEVDTRDKFLLCRHRPSIRMPRGQALLSRCYWPWFLRSSGWRFYARFLERNASPLLVGKSKNTTTMAAALAQAVASATVAVGDSDSVESVGAGRFGDAYTAYCDAVDRRIQKAILGQTLTTDNSRGGGAYALGAVHNEVRMDRRLADIRLVTPVMQNYVDALVRLNFGTATAPRVVIEDDRGLQLERAERDLKLTQAGVKFTPKYWQTRYDLEPDEIDSAPPQAPPPAQPVKASRASLFAASPEQAQEAIDALADRAIAMSGSAVDVDALKGAITAATGPDDLIDRLEALVGDMPAAQFRQLMEQALFAADVIGYANGEP